MMVELKENETLIGAIDLGTSSTRFLVMILIFKILTMTEYSIR